MTDLKSGATGNPLFDRQTDRHIRAKHDGETFSTNIVDRANEQRRLTLSSQKAGPETAREFQRRITLPLETQNAHAPKAEMDDDVERTGDSSKAP